MLDAELSQFLHRGSGDFFADGNDGFAFVFDVFFRLHSLQMRFAFCFDLDVKFTFFNGDFICRVKAFQNFGVVKFSVFYHFFQNIVGDGFHINLRVEPKPKRTQKNRRQNLTLAKSSVQNSLLVKFKLNPRTAIRNDFRQISVTVAFKKHARTSV